MANNQLTASPSKQVSLLADSLTTGLTLGQQYVQLLKQLAETESAAELLDAAQQLVTFDLDNVFVKFPQHYQPTDYYLLLMGRLLEMHSNTDFQIQEDLDHHDFYATISSLGDQVHFKFIIDANGTAQLIETQGQEALLYLNLKHKMLRFNNRALVNYFIIALQREYSDLDIRAAVKPLLAFAHALAADLDFVIDLGILDVNNDQHFALQQPTLSLTVIDRLFVATAEFDYMLLNLPQNNGAELRLDRGIKMDLQFDPDDYSQQWFFKVQDPDNQVSFFDLLLHYQLVRQWYLQQREALAVKSDPLLFADDQSSMAVTDDPVATEPTVICHPDGSVTPLDQE
ncbi:hypothetical protein FD27_GL001121 [Limosilactobacillus frumenti DSM 13145]|uniref:Uncharacterized protein n=1 Tax=Limosilactobacillus frumenti DSM 13145 TaxID=1423746 RepID=A0A0R1PEH0_9LACO|nr:hypothetical protein [Limosilactobacillus frumenti]KRL27363.1 hypothetical protein FD27_GL001121 [Limosilactobacillus frumenti DSM 13145]QFG72809.1 hypothetical protein LF145_05435 [Limosilactobacillus frumenti]